LLTPVHRRRRVGACQAAALLGLALAGACGPPAENTTLDDPHGPVSWQPGSWTIVWQDEFEGAAGTAPDPTKWVHETGGWGWGNMELQNYTDSTSNAALDGDGHLVITARAEMSGANAYTSARLTTQGLYARTYGRFEARMRLAKGRGLWPAFWILGDDFDAVGWPSCGEMDIVEERGGSTGEISSSLHGPQRTAAIDVADTQYELVPGGADADYHVYAVEWDPADIVFLVDDKPFFQLTPARRPLWVYDHPFFMLLNLAVGGLYPGPPDATTMLPQSISVDYVRVSVRSPDGGTDAAADVPADAAEAEDDALVDATDADDAPVDAGADDAGAGDAPASE
jgi:beta-glucanase (GH16 family)